MLSYAEVHYRPRFVLSRIFKKEPEIVFDTPSRVEHGCSLPIFLFVKDADRYPITLENVIIRITYEDGIEREITFPFGETEINQPFWWDSFNFIPERIGIIHILPAAVVKLNGKRAVVTVDNYCDTTQSPLVVNASGYPLPTLSGWYHGDIHCHTYHTSDQIEFGAPLEALAIAGKSSGLHWIAATDHSYDLDDKPDDYLSEDPALLKWRTLQREAELLAESFTIIPGEEVTCRTRAGRNCHMLALNSKRFIRGSGDSGENGLRSHTEHTVPEAVSVCRQWGGVACAAHPFERIPAAEKLILNRGEWSYDDITSSGIIALQIHNGVRDSGYRRGLETWRRLLLEGHRLYIFGGSDSHGDFNRRRAIGTPLFSIVESMDHLFGTVRTIVRSSGANRDDIVDALEHGHAQVSEGPIIDLNVSNGDVAASPGDEICGNRFTIEARCLSSPEFGAIESIRIITGVSGDETEITVDSRHPTDDSFDFTASLSFEKRIDYIRVQCETRTGKLCLTNPVWITRV